VPHSFITHQKPNFMQHISVKIGLWMLVSFIAYFLLLYATGFGYRTELQLFNVVIQLYFIYRSIRAYYASDPENTNSYMLGVIQGMRTSAIGVGGFAFFMMIFLALNPTLMSAICQNSQVGAYLNPFTATIVILAEGLMVGLIGSYIFTRISEDEPITKEDKIT
jgi:hypothetical protein